ncbi:MAG TPA: ATP-binding protein [Desulfohalobiaceae bacterium]|nr:ATP-binding protein [Desulfohalobiaceae bacterium]
MPEDREETYLLSAIDSLQREFVVISNDHTVMAANEFTKRKYGQDVIGSKCYVKFFQQAAPCQNCPVNEAKSCEPKKEQEEENGNDFLSIDSSFMYYSFDPKGLCPGVIRLDFDLSKLGKLEKKLRRSNAFLHNLIMSSVDAVIAADKKGQILIFNDAASEILGYSKEEALTQISIRDIYPERIEKDIMYKLRSEEHGGKGKLKAYQVNAVSKYGEIIPIRLNASIIYEKEAEVATIGFFYDLRESMKMEKELEETRIQLFQSSKMAALGKLAAGVAHQINNPLGGIQMFAQLLLEEYNLKEEAVSDIQCILDDAQRCRDTVKELLEFARQSSHKAQPTDLNRALSRTMFLLEKQALFHDITITQEFDTNLPYVTCDLQQMSNVFMNIILNAADAMNGQGELTLKTYHIDEEYVGVIVSDTGSGIPEDVLTHIFDPFFTTKEEGKGTGLGLSVAYRIVSNHGGKITVQNNEDRGATFHIKLPIGPSQGEQENDATE